MESLLNVGGDDHCQILFRGVGKTVSKERLLGVVRLELLNFRFG